MTNNSVCAPQFSTIVLTHNRASFIVGTISPVLDQIFASLVVLVHDDASIGLAAEVVAFSDVILRFDAWVRLLTLKLRFSQFEIDRRETHYLFV